MHNKRRCTSSLACIAALALATVPLSTHASAVDYFLKIEGIEGESTDEQHQGEIEILSFSWGASNSGTFSGGGGGGAGKVSFSDLTFTTRVNKATPKLMLACASGQPIPQATLVCRKSGDQPVEYLRITLSDVLVSSFSTGGSAGGDRPTESVSLNFAAVVFVYTPEEPDGSPGEPVRASWDLRTATQ
jgi:type VI secretion system secreted protein Hcp